MSTSTLAAGRRYVVHLPKDTLLTLTGTGDAALIDGARSTVLRISPSRQLGPFSDAMSIEVFAESEVTAAQQLLLGRVPGTFTYATLPSASLYPAGTSAFTTDQGTVLAKGGVWYTQQSYAPPERLLLGSFGDSVSSQDYPSNVAANSNILGVSPMFWCNALTSAAFDYVGPDLTAIVPSGGTQTTSTNFFNGVMGFSGGLITQFCKYTIDQYLAKMVALAGGRKFAVLLCGGLNDFANNDVAGHDATVWAEYLTIVDKITALGGLPIMKCGEITVNNNTLTKRRNVEAFRARVLSLAAARSDVVALDVRAAFEKYAPGVPYERLTRGSGTGTGDEIHPNATGAVVIGLGFRDALKGRVRFAPPWEWPDFAGTIATPDNMMTGTGGTRGTNCNGAAEVATGWTLVSNGASTAVNATQDVAIGGGNAAFMDASASGSPAADSVGYNANVAPTIAGGGVYRGFCDIDVLQADYVNQLSWQIRETSGNFMVIGVISSADGNAMTATVPNAAKLLQGARVVTSSFPFVFSASPVGTLFQVGGSASFTSNAAGRLRTVVRFGGLIRQA